MAHRLTLKLVLVAFILTAAGLLGVHSAAALAPGAADEPAVTVRLSAPAVRQGDVLVVRVSVQGNQVAGGFGDAPLRFAPEGPELDGGRDFIALLGIDALREPGPYPMLITATVENGVTEVVTRSVDVRPGRYIRETVVLTSALKSLLDPALNAQEEEEVRAFYSGFTLPQWWDGPFRLPVKGKLLSVYGNRRIYNGVNLGTYHSGYDYSAIRGTPVKAAAPGRVAAVREFAIRGLTVVLDHGRGVFTSYYHLSKAGVSEGQLVDVGDEIGQVGSTGRSQGNHLHFELAVGGSPVDPGRWMGAALP